MTEFTRAHNVKPVIIPELGRDISWRQDLVSLWKLYRLMLRARPDIVHTHTAKAGTLGRIAAILARVPIRIHTFHGHVFHGYFSSLKGRLFVWIERLLARFTTCIIAISARQVEELHATYHIAPRSKFAVIPLGVNLDPFLERDSSKNGNDPGRERIVVIGMVGRLVSVKNHRMALLACERLLKERACPSPIQLVIAGDGELRNDLELLSDQLGLRGIVRFEGWRTDVTKIYDDFDLVLMTSLNEGTPLTLIETMASGLPFVATNVGGIPDLMVGGGHVEKKKGPLGTSNYLLYTNGILVESGDIAGCAAAIAHLAADPDQRRRMGEAGRDFVRNRFDKQRLLRDMRNLYESILGTNP
jgi:glycosyltransferase involved in cell wall biosynthesis